MPTGERPAVRDLKIWLRAHVADVRYVELASRVGCSSPSISKMLGGTSLPALEKVLRLAAAVNAPQQEAHAMWYAAALEDLEMRSAERGKRRTGPVAEFGTSMQKLMLRAGLAPGDMIRKMEAAAVKHGGTPMSRSTLGRMLTGKTLPSFDQVNLFLRVVAPDDIRANLLRRHETLQIALEIARDQQRGTGEVQE